MEKLIHSEGTILKLLHSKYKDTATYKVSNIYLFKDNWETDFFVLQKGSGYAYDIEVKISKSDFFADFKKTQKHSILQNGTYEDKWRTYDITTRQFTPKIEVKEWTFRPNRFYYCVPTGLISKEEVPKYAGLMYASDYGITIVKEAPFIHKTKLSFTKALCSKFYYYWVGTEIDLRKYRESNLRLREEIKELKEKINV